MGFRFSEQEDFWTRELMGAMREHLRANPLFRSYSGYIFLDHMRRERNKDGTVGVSFNKKAVTRYGEVDGPSRGRAVYLPALLNNRWTHPHRYLIRKKTNAPFRTRSTWNLTNVAHGRGAGYSTWGFMRKICDDFERRYPGIELTLDKRYKD
jgi:hypothetical protein